MNTEQNTPAGTVYLVGAGPGDPGLLTIAGRDAIAAADILLYDRLAHPSLLEYARSDAERIFVGKASARHFVKQEDTNALMARYALEGKTVVRLKGGDPFVFGRGGEEAEYLRERGVPFVIVPGVTSAIAAPAYAGIPVTHRDAASSFAVITGHERDEGRESGTRDAGGAEQRRRWDHIAHAADTLVFLMGVEALGEISARLRENGRAPETPVALVQWGTWAKQKVAVGTLEDIEEVARREGITPPAVTVVGDVVRWRERIRWFDDRPLFGKRVLVTRARDTASTLSARLRALGADPIEYPTIRILPPEDGYTALDAALATTPGPDWLLFTSANAVAATFDRLGAAGRDARALANTRVAAIGPGTADALRKQGIRADFVPTEAVAETVLAEFPGEVAGLRMLMPRAAAGRDTLPDGLRARGATVEVVPAYQTVPDAESAESLREALAAGAVDIITFTSASTVTNFVDALGEVALPEGVTLACIGPVTAETCAQRLRPADVIAEEHTIDGLLAALLQHVTFDGN